MQMQNLIWRSAGGSLLDDNRLPFDNSYARLPGHFFARVCAVAGRRAEADPIEQAAGRRNSTSIPHWLESPQGVDMLAGQRLPPETDPIATAYAGHQFGQFVPQLGDGRAILLGEVIDRDGVRRDIQLKGAGRTPFSRGGDGRAALGPVLREYIVSEAMAALGIPTTRALAAVADRRHGAPRDPAARCDPDPCRGEPYPRRHVPVSSPREATREGLRDLADHVIARHYPEAAASERPIGRCWRR